ARCGPSAWSSDIIRGGAGENPHARGPRDAPPPRPPPRRGRGAGGGVFPPASTLPRRHLVGSAAAVAARFARAQRELMQLGARRRRVFARQARPAQVGLGQADAPRDGLQWQGQERIGPPIIRHAPPVFLRGPPPPPAPP